MKVTKRIKMENDVRVRRYQLLRARIARSNDSGYPDDVVLAILKAKHGMWSHAMTAEELLADLGLSTSLASFKQSAKD